MNASSSSIAFTAASDPQSWLLELINRPLPLSREDLTMIGKKIIALGKDVVASIVNKNSDNLMVMAAENGHAEVVTMLHQAGMDVDEKCDSMTKGVSTMNGLRVAFPAHCAAQNGHADVIRALDKAGANFLQWDLNDYTPPGWAARGGHGKALIAFHEAGVDLSQPDRRGRLLANEAARSKNGASAIVALHMCGVDLTKKNKHGSTPAIDAAYEGHTDVIRAIHLCGVDLRKAPHGYLTPLELATKQGHLETAQVIASLIGGGIYSKPQPDVLAL